MAYDEQMAERLRTALEHVPDVTEKRMFGGLVFLVGGHMTVAAGKVGDDDILVRVPREDVESLNLLRGATTAVMGGRTMTGWMFVDTAEVAEDDALSVWVERALSVVQSLPPK